VQAVLPLRPLALLPQWAVLAAGVAAVAVAAGLVESLMARAAFRRVPLLLTAAFLLCVFAMLTAWKGGAA